MIGVNDYQIIFLLWDICGQLVPDPIPDSRAVAPAHRRPFRAVGGVHAAVEFSAGARSGGEAAGVRRFSARQRR